MKYSIKKLTSELDGNPMTEYGIYAHPDKGEPYMMTPEVFKTRKDALKYCTERDIQVES